MMKPTARPRCPHFASGPCAKRPGWSPQALAAAALGRSHRSAEGKAKLALVIEKSRRLLGVPEDYRIAIVPGSDTGAVEMVLWSLLGARGVEVLAWESFGKGWAVDIRDELKHADVRVSEAPYGELPDLGNVDFARDVVFTWNGTTSGVRVPDGNWIDDKRRGLTICDATSAAFAMALPWEKLDVVSYSWQKALGGEGQHGMLVLSARALERLAEHRPTWPIPKLFRMTKGGKPTEGLFKGETINTPSLLCVEDALDGLAWAERVGGLAALIRRTEANFAAIGTWVARTPWIEFLAADARIRSPTSVCLAFADPALKSRPRETRAALAARLARLLADEGVAFDIEAYREAPPGLRIWAGATVERADLDSLFPWLDWAWESVRGELAVPA